MVFLFYSRFGAYTGHTTMFFALAHLAVTKLPRLWVYYLIDAICKAFLVTMMTILLKLIL